MNKMKIAIIGVGNISELHIQAYKKRVDIELYAFCDINEKTLVYKGALHQVTRLYTNIDKMLSELPEIDAVSVCTWNVAHAECSIKALNAGKHVLCEKPMALNAQQAQEMKAAADRAGKKLMIGFVRRFGEDCAACLDIIKNGQLGEVYYAKANYVRRNGCPGGWFSDIKRSGGGPLLDLGVHIIDLVRYLVGNPKPISVYGATFHKLGNRLNIKNATDYVSIDSNKANDTFTVEDMATAMIRFENGLVFEILTSFTLNVKNEEKYIQLCGDQGGLKLDDKLEIYSEYNHYLADIEVQAPTILNFPEIFSNEINSFIDSIHNDTPVLASAEDGILIMKIIDAIYLSAKTHHEVTL